MKNLIMGITLMARLAAAQGLVAHEWGTYTSMQGSSGKTEIGLQHEEERLPRFVQGRGPCVTMKCADFILSQETGMVINQKLETPVIYFYSQTPVQATVKVDFPKGIITQYYPTPRTSLPGVGNVNKISGGTATWEAELTTKELTIPSVPPESVWAPSRLPKSMYLASGTENEKFIFYRGLGKFDVPIHVKSFAGGAIELENASAQQIPAVFLLRRENGRGEVAALGSVPANQAIKTADLKVTAQSPAGEDYVRAAMKLMKDSLVSSGLYGDEADAMLNTWKASYFETDGLKLLYVAPREWTDNLLPIQVTPQPTELVRTLVGRIEMLTADEETSYGHAIEKCFLGGTIYPAEKVFGRFYEAKLRRLEFFASTEPLRQYIRDLYPSY